jgi:hypothetical protein
VTKKKAKAVVTIAVEHADLEWLLSTVNNANALIVSEGLDDDEECKEIDDRLREMTVKYGFKQS